ncbi:MbcA/ParS/Xre antitoxin family protein [Opitutales bacterium ASA1]|uniref:MbcA/ParS/Xre antitoxin family protein n=1 Tax=Congregicoccus parvus TaxID=3081749 RepID=UPI002B2D571A|nr:MbcA/ParS/Xre antitoxin family protein [Opitutales bacterium ASA1]
MTALVQKETTAAGVHTPAAGRVALKGFFAIAEAWGLAAREQQILLGGIGRTTLAKYRKLPEVALARDLLERISYVFGIHKSLLILLGTQERASAWLRKPNRAVPFNGQAALERMLAGSVVDLAVVRDHLDAARG